MRLVHCTVLCARNATWRYLRDTGGTGRLSIDAHSLSRVLQRIPWLTPRISSACSVSASDTRKFNLCGVDWCCDRLWHNTSFFDDMSLWTSCAHRDNTASVFRILLQNSSTFMVCCGTACKLRSCDSMSPRRCRLLSFVKRMFCKTPAFELSIIYIMGPSCRWSQ